MVTMAANRTVIVLAPNGRRQNVKVTLNTTILQILEEVCRKQGYNVDDYDIKHIHQILDPNMIFRFAGLPNNAQLEMVACTKMRSTSNVIIGIQPEDGKRVMREFPPNITLAQALIDIYPDTDFERAVLIYMHREISGREALEKTTLKSLGLNSGKAILRLIYRDPEQLKNQAHISTPLLPKTAVAVDDLRNKNCQILPSPTLHSSKAVDNVTSTKSVPNTENQEKMGDMAKLSTEENEKIKISVQNEVKMDIEDEKVDMTNENKNMGGTSVIEETHSIASTNQKDHDTEKKQNPEVCVRKVQEDMYKIQFLGERNALVFNQAEIQTLPKDDELPDNFFDLDLHDAKTLLRDAKRRREELEDAPFLTETQRQLNRDKRILDQLNKYRRVIIRVQFPDQFVLQGLFGPLESIRNIKDFIKNYLEHPDCEFTIYTAPPKHVLNPEARLLDENLIPSAIIYYSGQSSLKSDVKAKLTDPRAADIEAVRCRTGTMQKEQNPLNRDDINTIVESGSDHVIPGPSGSKSSSSLSSSSSSMSSSMSTQNQNRIPKWFKQAFK